jgi:hypothetical protein
MNRNLVFTLTQIQTAMKEDLENMLSKSIFTGNNRQQSAPTGASGGKQTSMPTGEIYVVKLLDL